MIKELLIKNFEAHDKFKAKLDPGITTFTGATDAGKSSIIRAIQWVVLNRPLGDSFIRDENKPAFVGLKTENGIVSRKKGKGINIYKVNGQTLEAFGANVPEEVKQFLGMEELNFQLQFDAPYWFMISPGEVSKQLNQIVDLEIIDSTLSNLNNKIRQTRMEVTLSEKRLDEVSQSAKHLRFVKRMSADFQRLEQLSLQIDETRSNFVSMSESVQTIERYLKRKKRLSKGYFECERALKTGIELQKATFQVESLSKILCDLEKASQVSTMKIPNIKQLVSITNKYNKTEQLVKRLSDHIAEMETEQERICQTERKLESDERKLKKMIGQTCPLCGSLVKIKS